MIVITALVAVIHRGASVIYQDNSTPVEPWITGTSPVTTITMGLPLSESRSELNRTAVQQVR